MMKRELDISSLCEEAKIFSEVESKHQEKTLYGVTDGKAVGTYFEHKFKNHLHKTYNYIEGNSASGIDFPHLCVDMKVTSNKQPQSSCPFKSAKQKIYGLGYSLLVFVYDKNDDINNQSGSLNILHTIFIEAKYTADYQTTTGLLRILENDGNKEDIIAFLFDKSLPVDDITATEIAEEIIKNPPTKGYLTISNALQWRLQYQRAINSAGSVIGINKIS